MISALVLENQEEEKQEKGQERRTGVQLAFLPRKVGMTVPHPQGSKGAC